MVEWATAAATIVLVLLTGWYVFLTSRLSKEARASSDAAQRAAEEASRSADAAERAVLTESMPMVLVTTGGGNIQRWQLVLENLGRSSAFHVLVEVYPGFNSDERVAWVGRDVLRPGEQVSHELDAESSQAASELMRAPVREHRCEALFTNAFGRQFHVIKEVGPETYVNIRSYTRHGNFEEWVEVGQ